jgi:L-malate glycosyltransferase
MNILFLCSWYPTEHMPHAGLFIKEHACAIHKAGNNIKVIAIIIKPSNKILTSEIRDFVDEYGINTTIILLHTKHFNLAHYNFLLQLFYLNKLIKKIIKENKYKIDLVHSNVIFPSGILGYLIAKKLQVPHVISEHWSRLNRMMKIPVFSYFCKKVYLNSQRILPVSDFLKKNIQSHIPNIQSNKFHIIGNIVNPDLFRFVEKQTDTSDTIHFCAIATWAKKKTPDKLPELFIEALSILKSEIEINISLTMIGGGDRVDELHNLCQKMGISANFTRHIEKEKIASFLQSANFFLHASTIETFSIVVAEALSCGTPVICSNVGALPELVNESNGVLCENTVDSWVEGIKKAMITPYDYKKIAESIGNKLNYHTIGKKINEVYAQLNKQ